MLNGYFFKFFLESLKQLLRVDLDEPIHPHRWLLVRSLIHIRNDDVGLSCKLLWVVARVRHRHAASDDQQKIRVLHGKIACPSSLYPDSSHKLGVACTYQVSAAIRGHHGN